MPKLNLKSKESQAREALNPQRGSIVSLKKRGKNAEQLAIVVSNDIQNEVSDFFLVVPLERRISRLKAPFAIDLGRSDGLRALHCARCDWVTRVGRKDLSAIVRAGLRADTLERLDSALRVAFNLDN